MLERYSPERLWREAVAAKLDIYMGHEFELIARQAYDRLAPDLGLPLVREWGNWQGKDRNGEPLEIDIVAPLLKKGMLTGAAKAGRKWAHQAQEPDAPLLYVAAGGFTPAFASTVAEDDRPITLWTLDELYQP